MKITLKHCSIAILCLFFVSCIQNEALNSEAAIDGCTGSSDVITTEIDADARTVDLFVTKTADLTHQAVEFTLPEGATISPAGGTIEDFSSPRFYTVTSQDGKWVATYTVTFRIADIPTQYHFEDIHLSSSGSYQIFTEYDNGKALIWSSGNKGYELTGVTNDPLLYPTLQDDNGETGKCLKLVTRSTGFFGTSVGMPIAAGSLFIGTFDASKAFANPLLATQFGAPFYNIPTSLTGFYKYKSGDTYKQGNKAVPGKRDQCDIYAIFYETDDSVKMLNGTNALTSDHLVSVARISNQIETDEWTRFDIPFVNIPGKLIDPSKLVNGKYSVSIVFSSSIDGGNFNGAVGSTLFIDEVTLNN